MSLESVFKVWLAAMAIASGCMAQGLDAKKTKELFAGTTWNSHVLWHGDGILTFEADGTLVFTLGDSLKRSKWNPSGPGRVKSNDGLEWMMTADKKELHLTKGDHWASFRIYYPGKEPNPAFPYVWETLAQKGIVWVKQGKEKQLKTWLFTEDGKVVYGEDGIEKEIGSPREIRDAQIQNVPGLGAEFYLIKDSDNQWVLRHGSGIIVKPMPADPKNPLVPLTGKTALGLPGIARDKTQATGAVDAAEADKLDGQLAMECEPFARIWESYKASADKIRDEFQPKFGALRPPYLESLERLKATAQSRGDLNKAKIVAAEIKRFMGTLSVPPAPEENTITEIRTLQANYNKSLASLEKDMNARLAPLTARYAQVLGQLKTELTRDGKLDEATAVSEAQERRVRKQ